MSTPQDRKHDARDEQAAIRCPYCRGTGKQRDGNGRVYWCEDCDGYGWRDPARWRRRRIERDDI